MSQLLLSAFFFTMRSCKYVKVLGECQMKLLTLLNIHFYMHHHLLPHDNSHHAQADTVSITFKFQKHEEKDDIITQHQTNHDILCTV